MNASYRPDPPRDRRRARPLLGGLLPLFVACSVVGEGAEATPGRTGVDDNSDSETDTEEVEAAPAVEAPLLVGDLSCAEPGHAGAVEQDAPPDTEMTVPASPGLPELLAEIRAHGGRPGLRFDRGDAGQRLNVRVAVDEGSVERSVDGSEDVMLDLGALVVRLTHATAAGSEAQALVVPQGLPLDQALVLKTYARARTSEGLGPAALTMVSVFDRRDEQAGPVASLAVEASMMLTRSADCDALALEMAQEVPPVAVRFPRLTSCTLDECAKTKAAWLRANHDLYRALQILDFIAASPAEDRAWLWSQEGGSESGERLMSYESDDVGPNTSLSFYFGGYEEYRFDAIRWAFTRLWRSFQDHEIGGLKLDIECTPEAAGDICNTTKPGGHHAIKSNMKLCGKAYSTTSQGFDVPRLVLHEAMHHMFVPWKKTTPRLSPIMDTHTHGHGVACAGKLVTDKGYGLSRIKHLAGYRNTSGGDCYHNNLAFRNNDSFAYAAATIGTYIRFGYLDRWPVEQAPEYEENYPDPECGTPGVHTPPPEFYDPLSSCYKSGGQLVCPGSHGGLAPAQLDIAVICPRL